MKVLKALGILLLVLIVAAAIATFVLPTTIELEEEVTVNAPAEQVWAHLTSWEERDKWSPWRKMDAGMKVTYEGEEGTEGSKMAWEGDTVGTGNQTITKIDKENGEVHSDLNFFQPNEGGGKVVMKMEETDEGVKTTYKLSLDAPRPMNVLFTLMGMKKFMSQQYGEGLNEMKAVLEASANEAPTYDIKKTTRDPQAYIGKVDTVSFANMQTYWAESSANFQAMEEQGAMLCGLYFDWNEEKQEAVMTTAIPTGKDKAPEGFDLIQVDGGAYLELDYYGAYDGIKAAHMALDGYLNANNLEVRGPVMEEYVTDPMMEPDTTKWLTRLAYPVQEKTAEETES
jgi:effector-binding domain-containing protein/uncharacterized protein YndB with AHSA1/START domain